MAALAEDDRTGYVRHAEERSKEATWIPSATQVRAELKRLGRGNASKEQARNIAAPGGEEPVDEAHDEDPTALK